MRQTQLDTLKLATRFPDGLLIASDVAVRFGRSMRASDQRLERLVDSGHLRRVWLGWVDGGMVCCYALTDVGRGVLDEVAA